MVFRLSPSPSAYTPPNPRALRDLVSSGLSVLSSPTHPLALLNPTLSPSHTLLLRPLSTVLGLECPFPHIHLANPCESLKTWLPSHLLREVFLDLPRRNRLLSVGAPQHPRHSKRIGLSASYWLCDPERVVKYLRASVCLPGKMGAIIVPASDGLALAKHVEQCLAFSEE